MENTIFGRPVPRLGFGCMRLPESQAGEYIEEECQQMFVKNGPSLAVLKQG